MISLYTDSLYDSLEVYTEYYRVLPDKIATSLADSFDNIPFSTFNCQDDILSISGAKTYIYHRVNRLPYGVIEKIYENESVNKTNYTEEFLGMDVRSVCTDQVDIFDGINGAKEGYLVRGDLVEVIADQGDWVHIKYLRTDKEYWTHKSCLE